MKNIFFLTLIALVLFACGQSDADQTARTFDSYIRFMKPEGQIHAEASLKMRDDKHKDTSVAVPNGGIRYQGGVMPEVSNTTHLYMIDRRDTFRLDHTFSWEDENKQRIQFKWNMSPMLNGHFRQSPLDMDSTAIYTWEGGPLQRGEAVVFMWQHNQTHQTIPMEIIATGADFIEFPGKKIRQLETPGLWTMYTVRKKLQKDTVNGITGSCILEYFSAEDSVRVVR